MDNEQNSPAGEKTSSQRLRVFTKKVLLFGYYTYIAGVLVAFVAATARKLINSHWPELPNWEGVVLGANAADWRLPFFLAAAVIAFLTFVGIIWCFSRFLKQAWLQKETNKTAGFMLTCRNVFVGIQGSKRYFELYNLQLGLRACLVFFVVTASVNTLSAPTDPPHLFFSVLACSALHIWLSAAYVIACLLAIRRDRPVLRNMQTDGTGAAHEITNKAGRILWVSSIFDIFYITCIWGTNVLPSRPYHLGYIIPILTTWLFVGSQPVTVFVLILTGLFAHLTWVLYQISADGALARSLGLDGWGFLIPIGELGLCLAFWFCLGLVLSLLRDAQDQLKTSLRASEVIRQGLDTLAVQQGLAVFAKDMKRRFIFANSIFRQKLAQFLNKPSVSWEWLAHKSDDEIGLTAAKFPEYKNSDEAVLTATREEDEHYQNSEPSFVGTDEVIWTRKELIRDSADGGKLGLIGYVVDGLPIEFSRIQLPFYASVKNSKGHVLWANPPHLKKLEPAIRKLYEAEYKVVPARETNPASLMRKLRSGAGPKDEDLYGPDGKTYYELDRDIEELAREAKGDATKFNESMEALIRRRGLPRRRSGSYPQNGWLEFHKFPPGASGERGANEGIWVEVWKMAWLEKAVINGELTYVVKGVLVFFEDVHTSYLRENFFWRGVSRHVKCANDATEALIEETLKDQEKLAESLRPSLAIGEVVRRMLMWFQALAEETGAISHISFSEEKDRGRKDLEGLLETLKLALVPLVPIEMELADFKCPRRGEDLFCLIFALVIRAVDATKQFRSSDLPAIGVIVQIKDGNFILMVTDKAIPHAHQKSASGSISDPLGWQAEFPNFIPAEGYYLARKIAERMWADWAREAGKKMPNLDTKFWSVPYDAQGSTVTVMLPLSVFDLPKPVIPTVANLT